MTALLSSAFILVTGCVITPRLSILELLAGVSVLSSFALCYGSWLLLSLVMVLTSLRSPWTGLVFTGLRSTLITLKVMARVLMQECTIRDFADPSTRGSLILTHGRVSKITFAMKTVGGQHRPSMSALRFTKLLRLAAKQTLATALMLTSTRHCACLASPCILLRITLPIPTTVNWFYASLATLTFSHMLEVNAL